MWITIVQEKDKTKKRKKIELKKVHLDATIAKIKIILIHFKRKCRRN
jgi:hypothetical protein